ncbi:hypothetical protein ACFCZ1_11055 [Streptomyces sp. NPDC056224]|uniref:hypothetical protein n=1 Tax=Streptomyces sp. NPDC056224 TaxID=3345750 RepID=UPI0035DEF88C
MRGAQASARSGRRTYSLVTVPRQGQTVWIYEKDGGPRAQVVDVVLHPEKHDARAVLDGLPAGRNEALTPEQKLDRIRDVIGS